MQREQLQHIICSTPAILILSGHGLGYLPVAPDDLPVAIPPVGVYAAGAVLTPVGTVDKISAAFWPEKIEGAVAEKAVEIVLISSLVAGKMLTLPVGKIGALLIHSHNPLWITAFLKQLRQQYNSPSIKTQDKKSLAEFAPNGAKKL